MSDMSTMRTLELFSVGQVRPNGSVTPFEPKAELAKLAKEDVSKRYAEDLDLTLASARRQLTLIEQELEKPVQLPGPTGESNKLYLEPRGVIS